ncbi:cytidine deaminase [Myceligenerans sp. TRM 65318]|uniref:Cytidine deaminase n=1 Tax=Myceligenerans pegani TaxID=2776917 RepID=A0ABR9N0C5_9MICO|nr:cytidine deaminase [Myceligenerans sp. TRM 65318]MBE3019378.1 cytidine deaminase [Myceligenerans sp. TRM 65318]
MSTTDDGGHADRTPATDATTTAVVHPDWEALREAARDALRYAYAPYSGFPVGAAALADDGRLLTGANVENAAYGVTLCAECSLVSALMMSGGGRLVAFTCTDADGRVIMACGRCRQLLWEHGGPELLVETPRGVLPMDQVLPQAFGPEDLARVRDGRSAAGDAAAGDAGAAAPRTRDLGSAAHGEEPS